MPCCKAHIPRLPAPPVAIRAKPIVLVGLMGVGKSTVGRRLAQRLRLPFVDADHEIEAAAGMTVAEIFERFGEAYFRDGERRVIARLIDGTPKVIATGGGAFINDETRALILAEATAIWLSAHPDVLAERVGRRDTRPLLRGKRPAPGARRSRRASATRSTREAHIHIASNTAPHETTVNAILKAIGLGGTHDDRHRRARRRARYPILIEAGLLARAADHLAPLARGPDDGDRHRRECPRRMLATLQAGAGRAGVDERGDRAAARREAPRAGRSSSGCATGCSTSGSSAATMSSRWAAA